MADDDDGGSDAEPLFPLLYDTLEEAKNYIYANARNRGYEIAIKRSYVNRLTDKVRRCELVCDKSITYKVTVKKRRRDTSSVKIDCSWRMILVKYLNQKQ